MEAKKRQQICTQHECCGMMKRWRKMKLKIFVRLLRRLFPFKWFKHFQNLRVLFDLRFSDRKLNY